MAMIDGRDARALGGALLFGLAAYGCAEASGPQRDPALAQTILYTQDAATEAATQAGFTFDDSRQDGDALVLSGVRYGGEDGVVVTAKTLRLEGMGEGADGRLRADRNDASGIVIETDRQVAEVQMDGADGDERGEEVLTGAVEATRTRIDRLVLDDASYRAPDEAGEDADDAARRAAAASVATALSFGALEASGIAFGEPSGDASGTLSRLRVGGYEDGVLGRVRLDDLEVRTPTNAAAVQAALSAAPAGFAASPLARMLTTSADRTRIDEVVWTGANAAGVIGQMAQGEAPGLGSPDVVVGDLILRGQTTLIGDEVASTVRETRVSDLRFEGAVPTNAVVRTKGAVSDMTAFAGEGDEEAVRLLEARGLDSVRGASLTRIAYDPAAGRLTATSEADTKGLYGLRFALDVGGLDSLGAEATDAEAEIQAADPAAAARAAFGDAALYGLTLSVTDEQLLDTAFELAALGGEQSAMELRQQAVGVVTLGALQGGAISPRVPDYAGAVSSFLSNGGTLTIRMTPEGGLGATGAQAAMAAGPGGLLDAADLTIRHEP